MGALVQRGCDVAEGQSGTWSWRFVRSWTMLGAMIGAELLAVGAPAQERVPSPVPTGPPTHAIGRASGAILVDGVLDEAAWSTAVVVNPGFETYPGNNLPARVATECLLAYDDDHLYVAFRARDGEPGKVRAHLTDRDAAFDDDFVGVVLDTFNDERRGYEFFVNPLGVQMDLVQDDVNKNEDSAWDAIWASAGRVDAEGYTVEMAIPFAQLRFARVDGPQTWGIDVIRVYPRDQRFIFRSQPQDRNRSCYLCQVSKLTGLEGIRRGKNLELDPTLTGVRSEELEDFPHGPWKTVDSKADPGISGRWGFTPNLTALAAINPDFSQVEADVAQLDVNTDFALFYPEKRPFFLEGADLFETPGSAIYTRTVADPAWGAKVSGKEGKTAVGAYVARDEVTNILLPGKESSDLTTLGESSLAGVARVRRDVGANSTLGALVTARQGDRYSNRVVGLDGLLLVAKADRITFQVLCSATEYPDEIRDEFGQPDGTLSDLGAVLRYEHQSRDWWWKAEASSVGREFRADSGFVPQVDVRQGTLGLQRTWWGAKDAWRSRTQWGGDWNYSTDQDGELIENEFESWANFNGPMQSYVEIDVGWRERVYEGERFDMAFQHVYGEIRPSGALWLGVAASFGDQLDFANGRNGRRLRVEPEITWRAGTHLSLEVSVLHEHLDVEGGRLFTADLPQLRLVYQFNVRTFVRLISQYTDVERDPSLYEDEVDARSRDLFNQLLFSYKINPQTVFFLGYSDTSEGFENEEQRVDLTRAGRTVFVKLGYAWLL